MIFWLSETKTIFIIDCIYPDLNDIFSIACENTRGIIIYNSVHIMNTRRITFQKIKSILQCRTFVLLHSTRKNHIIEKSCDIKFIFRSSKLSTKESYFVSRIKRIISFHDIWNNFLNRLIGSPVKRRRLVLHSFCTASAVHCKHIHIKTISRLPFLAITLLLQDTIKAP